jgi:hypothetical protein
MTPFERTIGRPPRATVDLRNRIKFKLEYMLMMQACGRDEEADKAYKEIMNLLAED